MKRKRGKKGKSKKDPKTGTTENDQTIDNLSNEDVSSPEDTEKEETNSKMDIEKTSSTGTEQPEKPEKPPAVTSTAVTDKPLGRLVYNRVKVKIKPSKALEQQPQITSSDAHTTHSDTDKSSQLIGVEKQLVSEKAEDSANSVPESSLGVLTNQPKKTGSIKIKSSKSFSSSLSPCNNLTGAPQLEKTHHKESDQDSVYNKQELNASLEVIKKIMKMDAAEPFNVPVNPVALGIPDYFDVIKTPMDFGTICSNIESGVKYKNSEDVYKDVKYIWENCYKYNNKGDYVLELMKRVKKNFSKYWAAAGLYNQHQGDQKDGNISSHGKSSSKSGNPKNKSRKKHGVKLHKDDCLCAICIMMRRRKEREKIMNPNGQTETSDGLVQEVKLEGTSVAGSLNGDDASSSSDNSQNEDVDADMDDKREEMKLEKEVQSSLQNKQQQEKEKEKEKETVITENLKVVSKSGTEKQDVQMAEAGDVIKDDVSKMDMEYDEIAAVEQQKKPKELMDAGEKAKLYEKLEQRYDNPMVLELCASLFPKNPKSFWNKSVKNPTTSRKNSIAAAIATFFNKE